MDTDLRGPRPAQSHGLCRREQAIYANGVLGAGALGVLCAAHFEASDPDWIYFWLLGLHLGSAYASILAGICHLDNYL